MAQRADWYQHLRNEASRLLKQYALLVGAARVEDIELPVPLHDITAKVLRFEFLYTDEMEPSCSGFIDFDQELIWVSTRDRSKEHQRFSFGHEIGHGWLHRGVANTRMYRCQVDHIGAPTEATGLKVEWARFDVGRYLDIRKEESRTWRIRRREIEANVFASALTMPGAHLARIGEDARQDPVVLARTFGVSVSAMKWRLCDLQSCTTEGQLRLF